MACDICGERCAEYFTLRDEYATDEFKVCCSMCEADITKYIIKVRRLSNSFVRNMIIDAMKSKRARAGVFK